MDKCHPALGRFPSVMVITVDSDSTNLGSIPRETFMIKILILYFSSF